MSEETDMQDGLLHSLVIYFLFVKFYTGFLASFISLTWNNSYSKIILHSLVYKS